MRAKRVEQAERWPHGNEWVRRDGAQLRTVLSDCPVERPRDWTSWVNQPHTAAEQASLREHIRRGRPYGDEVWVRQTASKLNLQ